jgi:hypothetical protein
MFSKHIYAYIYESCITDQVFIVGHVYMWKNQKDLSSFPKIHDILNGKMKSNQ